MDARVASVADIGDFSSVYQMNGCHYKSAVTDWDFKMVPSYLPPLKPQLFSLDGTLVD